MQTTITTYNNITLILVEVPKDAYDFKIVPSIDNLDFVYKELSHKNILGYKGTSVIIKDTTENSIVELIGTTSTLTDGQVEPFVDKCFPFDHDLTMYYTNKKDFKFYKTRLECWNSMLKANNIDLSKEWVVLQIKND